MKRVIWRSGMIALVISAVIGSYSLGKHSQERANQARNTKYGYLALADYSTSTGQPPQSEEVTNTIAIPGTGVVINPPPESSAQAQSEGMPSSDTAPAVSQQQAAEAAEQTGLGGVNDTVVQPNVVYGLLTDSSMTIVSLPPGSTAQPGDSTAPVGTQLYNNTPVWVVEYSGVTTPMVGPQQALNSNTTTSLPPVSATSLTRYIFISAQTGKYLMGVGT